MSSKYLMNNILRATSQVALIKSLQDRPSPSLNATLRHVQLGVNITHSRLDDELNVATIEFHLTPQWLSHDQTSFPKYTALGTIWSAVDRHAIDEHGRTEFMRAVMKGGSHMDLLYAEMLAEFDDTDVNVQDDRGRTALHWACALSHQDMVALCLSVPDCDSGLLDHDGLTAFDISLRRGSNDETIPNMFYHNVMEMEKHAPQTALLRVLTMTSEAATDKPVFPGQAMFVPIEDADEPLVAALIARGIDFTATDSNGDTALHVAATKANLGIVRKLVNAGWDVNAVGNDGTTPLHRAARTRDIEVVKLLLDSQANVRATDDYGQTPLELAEDIDCEDLVQLLHAETDIPTTRDVEVVKLLLDSQANVRAKDDYGQTPLELAEDIDCEDLVQLLHAETDIPTTAALTPRPEMNARDVLSRGPMMSETIVTILTPQRETNEIPAHNDENDTVDSNWLTPLHRAARDGHTETVSALLAGGAAVDAGDNFKRTPLNLAAEAGHTETVSALLAGGATVDARNGRGSTPLHLAADAGHTATVSALLTGGATVDARDISEKTPLHLAGNSGRTETVSALLAGGATVDVRDNYSETPLHFAAKGGHTGTVSALLAGGATVDLRDNYTETPLHFAAKDGHTGTVSALLAGGATVDARDNFQETPLHFAAKGGHTETVSTLLAGGATVDAQHGAKWTPLHFAAKDGHTGTVSALLTAGATVDAQNGRNETPLYFSAEGGYTATVSALLAGGASIDLVNTVGETALDMAEYWRREDTIKILQDAGAKSRLCRVADIMLAKLKL